MTAEDIQSALRAFFDQSQTGRYHVNNVYFFNHGWGESDFLTFSKAGMVHEIEIKISVADFKNDFTKPKHRYMASGGWFIRRGPETYGELDPSLRTMVPDWPRCTSIEALHIRDVAPNRFSFAFPLPLAERLAEKVPPYAGVYGIEPGHTTQIRKAPVLHDTHHNFTQNLLDKYWWNRRKVKWDIDVARNQIKKLEDTIDRHKLFLFRHELYDEFEKFNPDDGRPVQ